MSIALLTIGTELTRGELVDTNSAWLAERVTQLGLSVTAMDTVDDDEARIEAALARLTETHQVLLCTGGLGPTTDDLTTVCAARVLGQPLELHAESLAELEQRFAALGRALADSNRKQAYFPRGATVLPNPEGTAPGFFVVLGSARAYFLPGVPSEMHRMYEASIEPWLREQAERTCEQIIVRTLGVPESSVNDALTGLEALHAVKLGYRAYPSEVEVKVVAYGDTGHAARTRARKAADEARLRLGTAVYGEGRERLPAVLGRLLSERGLTLATAESCTGGLTAELLTRQSGASAFFLGGVVAYANEVKTSLLGVAPELISEHGAVSEEVAREMALGVRRLLGTSFGLGITGVAGPSGGTPDKPVGLVWYACASEQGVTARRLLRPGPRERIREVAAESALALLWRALTAT
jgi:nicotinamide-nucleotide amidase